MSCIDLYFIEKVYSVILFSFHCVNTSGLTYVFEDVRNKLVTAHCTVTSNVLTVTDENHKRCIFSMFRSLIT